MKNELELTHGQNFNYLFARLLAQKVLFKIMWPLRKGKRLKQNINKQRVFKESEVKWADAFSVILSSVISVKYFVKTKSGTGRPSETVEIVVMKIIVN
jgi:hypothetical protein